MLASDTRDEANEPAASRRLNRGAMIKEQTRMIGTLLQTLRPWGPLFFGVGFLAPLIATLTTCTGLSSSLEFSSLVLGLAVGATWGLYAKLKGSWL